jgi:hypothetical protein
MHGGGCGDERYVLGGLGNIQDTINDEYGVADRVEFGTGSKRRTCLCTRRGTIFGSGSTAARITW